MENKTKEYDESYVLVHNIAKRHNVGTLARSATAFGVSEATDPPHTSASATSTSTLSLACSFLKEMDFDKCGVEIRDATMAVNEHPFKKNIAFVLGNEGFLQRSVRRATSLNVTVAASIVLHHFGGFSERTREGNKFVVAKTSANQMKRNFCTETAESIAEERKLKKENALSGFF